MRVEFHRDFKKQFAKLPARIQSQTEKRIEIFIANPDEALLRKHQLRGDMSAYWSINISGDYRALYEDCGEYYLFIKIGTHSELYG